MSEKALQTAMKRREVKGKRQKERYTLPNAKFQLGRRDKKAVLSQQCKEIEENNRMGKTRDLYKKIRDIKASLNSGQDGHNKGQKQQGPNRGGRD